ncbi:acyl carrier protein [Amycolatopsis japonica]|uniref:acyl carrier protein n=1 Tax=Amycolatopsis japonica TaxID=208439 RepID=UPI00367308EA
MNELAATDRESVCRWLTEHIARHRKADPATIGPDVPLAAYGLDSVLAVTLVADIEERYDLLLEPDTLWEYRTIALLADLVSARLNATTDSPGPG